MINNYLPTEYHPSDKIVDAAAGLGSIYLGDINSALDLDFIRQTRILTVITAADGMDHVQYPSQITHIRYPLYDMQSEKISRFFEDNFRNIEEGRARGNVLIHCAAGVSRSATLLISYLMRRESWTFRKAIMSVRAKRPVVCPNLGFERQLKQYEKTLVVKPRAYSIRFGPKTSEQPRSKNNQRTSLPQIPSNFNRTHLKLRIRQLFAKKQSQQANLDLEHNLVISGFRPMDRLSGKLPQQSSEQLEPRKQAPIINSHELKRLTIMKLGLFRSNNMNSYYGGVQKKKAFE